MKASKGFTLIELMITVAVIAIIVAIAYPSYMDSVRKGKRGAAQAFMMDVAQREQQMFLDRRSFVAAANNAAITANLNLVVPTEVSGSYNVKVDLVAGPPPGFLVTATGTGQQASDGVMTLDNEGNKTLKGNAGW